MTILKNDYGFSLQRSVFRSSKFRELKGYLILNVSEFRRDICLYVFMFYVLCLLYTFHCRKVQSISIPTNICEKFRYWSFRVDILLRLNKNVTYHN